MKSDDNKLKSEVVDEFQRLIINGLHKKEIYPFNVVVTFVFNNSPRGYITFFDNSMLNDFLELIEYKYLCQKGSFEIIKETNTVVLTDLLALTALLDKLDV